MAVARASMRLKLCPRLSTPYLPYRFASTAASTKNDRPRQSKPKTGPRINRYLSEDDRRFFRDDGTIFTTQANADFLHSHNIEHDNGLAKALNSAEIDKLAKRFRSRVQFSPRYILHPYDIKYLHPGGHTLAPKIRSKYAQLLHNEPLWIWVLHLGVATKAIVRTMVQRRMKSAVFAALERMGYGRSGKWQGELSSIQGTLLITLYNPVETASLSAAEFGQAIADALHTENGKEKPHVEVHAPLGRDSPAKRDSSTKRDSRAKRDSPTRGEKWDGNAKRHKRGSSAREAPKDDFSGKFGKRV